MSIDMTLKEIFDKHWCDKSDKHKYHTVYEKYFAPVREDPINILEIGVYKGSSTASLVEYFPNATVYGIDIFERYAEKDVPILKHERVKHIKGDSTSKGIRTKIKNRWGSDIKFDFIIDDGLHTPEANAKTLNNIFSYLSDNGVYFVEDVWPINIMTSEEMKHPWVITKSELYNEEQYNVFLESLNDKKVKHYDLRKRTKNPDSYLIIVENP